MAIPPPPYADITGTSQIIGKYNFQESIANVDGNARPGQLIVDLETDPPQVYVGNVAGNISPIGGGGGSVGNWLFNGNDVTVNNPGYPHLYGGPDGGPELSYIDVPGQPNSYSQTMYINDTGLNVSLDYGNVHMQLHPDGNLELTGSIITSGSTGNITGANVIQATTFISNVVPVSSLPAPTAIGATAFVNDSSVVASGNFGAIVAGGGGNVVPVYCDGINWRIG
jgi:hypothetical protein